MINKRGETINEDVSTLPAIGEPMRRIASCLALDFEMDDDSPSSLVIEPGLDDQNFRSESNSSELAEHMNGYGSDSSELAEQMNGYGSDLSELAEHMNGYGSDMDSH